MAIGVRVDKKRVKETADTTLTTPHGTEITVTKSRPEALLARTPVRFGDGTARKYVAAGEDNEVPTTTTKAAPPRKGDGRNAGE